jgi:uncharacterized protein (TIGR02145 family)
MAGECKPTIMKNKYTNTKVSVWRALGLLALFSVLGMQSATAQYTAIPDANFEQALFDLGIDTVNGDYQVETSAIIEVTTLDVSSKNIVDLTGIEGFINLNDLRCSDNQLTSLLVLPFTLNYLDCSNNQISQICSTPMQLTYLNCSHNQLTDIVTYWFGNYLSYFNCSYNQLTNLHVIGFINLTELICNNNQLIGLNVWGLNKLTSLFCENNQISVFNNNWNGFLTPNLQYFTCFNNRLTSLEISSLNKLIVLLCNNNQITTINASNLPYLNQFWCLNNQLTTLNVTGDSSLDQFWSYNNPNLSCIQVSDVAAAYSKSHWFEDSTVIYSLNCNLPTAPITNAQSFCAGATVANLVATGISLQWYTATTGGIALATTTILTSGSYYVSQTVGGAESTRTSVAVNITSQTSPTFAPAVAVCSGTSLTALPTTSTNGISGTWSPALNNTETTTYTFTPTAGQCASTTAMTITVETTVAPTGLANQIYAGTTVTLANLSVTGTNLKWYNNATSGTLLPNSTIVNDGTTYYASQTVLGCESTARLAVIAHKISDASQTFCNGALVNSLISTPTLGYTTNWFATNTGGVALTGSETLTTGTYYVEQRTTVNMVSTFAGSGASGDTDGIGATASFNSPSGVAVDASGNVYVAEFGNNKIRKITSAGIVSSFAGSGTSGAVDGQGADASFSQPMGVAVDTTGNIYVADTGNNKIRKITSSGYVTTIAGSGIQGDTDDVGDAASFNYPTGVAIDVLGNMYVSDYYNHKIRKITPMGTVSTFAGNEINGDIDGIGITASFYNPAGVSFDRLGNLCIADSSNEKIRKITIDGLVSTFAGNGAFGSNDGISSIASFALPTGVAVDVSGNVYVADYLNHKIRKITPLGDVTTIAGSNFYERGDIDGIGSEARFYQTIAIALDASGNIYVVDNGNNKIRKISSSNYISNRVAVNVIVNNNLAPTAVAQTFCTSATVANLTATGTNLQWYAAANGGTALATTTPLATGTYYVSQTIGTCESPRTAVTVTVTPQITPTFAPTFAVCSGTTLTALPTTSTNGISGTWSPVLDNTETTNYTFTPTPGQCATTNTQTITISNPLATSVISFVVPVITIGTQVWTYKDLDITTYRDGTPIPQVTDPTAWAALTTGAWCYYNNDPANGAIYGKLYNWYAVAGIHDNDPNTPNKTLALEGWHVPTDAEWTVLTDYLGGTLVAGGKMKSTGTSLWQSPNTAATNESGFTGVPGDFRNTNGAFGNNIGPYVTWWSSSENNTSTAWVRFLYYFYGNAYRSIYSKLRGYSVRLIKD